LRLGFAEKLLQIFVHEGLKSLRAIKLVGRQVLRSALRMHARTHLQGHRELQSSCTCALMPRKRSLIALPKVAKILAIVSTQDALKRESSDLKTGGPSRGS